ncbi:hypothetical protein [Kribbella pratensis]|uniref:Acetyltransferase (GNAT) family protein n=1 Tax=Kribbella pratensis TaxID=2512112 RepID=A0A4R8CGL7_9ACTN|nr:hypothetical protein [Kribbella pratensis]TDW75500.1 hypothetical protein EV653_0634 [Kribbella pratensis]
MNVTQYDPVDLTGIVALCERRGLAELGADLDRAHAVLIARHAFLTAPSVTSVVAVDAAQVIGFAYF